MAWMTTYDDIIKRDCVNCGLGNTVPRFGTKEYAKMFGNRTVPHMANYAKILKKKKRCHCGGGGGRCKCHEPIEQGVISPVFNEFSINDPLRRQLRQQMMGSLRATRGPTGGTHTRFPSSSSSDDDFDGSHDVDDGFQQDFGMSMLEYMQSTGRGDYGPTPDFVPDDPDDDAASEKGAESGATE